MSHSAKIRAVVHAALRQHPQSPEAIAWQIAEGLRTVTHNQVRPRKGWVMHQLRSTIQSALDRAVGSLEQAALAICRDLACWNPFGLVEHGWFQDDAQVTAFHHDQQARWHQQLAA